MSGETVPAKTPPGSSAPGPLRDAIGLREVLFQSITAMAPAASIPAGAASAGGPGDGHARKGEGETCGVTVECAMNTVVLVELLKEVATPWPRIESDSYPMSTGSARPLEDAFRISQLDPVQWPARDYGLSDLDAYQLVSQAGEAPLTNVCDTDYTRVAKIRKEWLPAGEPNRGLHRRLRETAAVFPRH